MSVDDIKSLINSTPIELPIVVNEHPDPLPENIQFIKFPLDALGEILGEAAKRMAYHVQVPEGIAGQSVLAVAALVAQQHINIELRNIIGSRPVSLYFLSIAESGDRKSSVDSLALIPIIAFESNRRQMLEKEITHYQTAMEAWQIRKDSILKAYAPTKKTEISQQRQEELAKKLCDLEDSKPKGPPRPNITFGEPTPEGIWKHYIQGEPSAGLFSDEGISFFGGHGMTDESKGRTIGMLSHLWDGKPINRTRGTEGESGVLAGRRLTTHLMVQPIISSKALADPILQGQGIMARFLICHEPSIAGTRFLINRDLTKGAKNDPAIGRYLQTITQLLERHVNTNESGELELKTSEIKGEALNTWCALHDGIEENILLGKRFADIKPFASKAAENAARIAAVLAFIEGYENPTVGHIERAGTLISYYLESMMMRTREALQDADALLARDLLEWIKTNGSNLTSNDFKRLSPISIRPAKKARKILAFLVESGHLYVSARNLKTDKPSAWKIQP